MTIRQAIDKADALRPNGIDRPTKVLWLRMLDGQLRREVVALHEGEAEGGADLAQNEEQPLLAAQPDSMLYLYWLMAQIDLAEGEVVRYTNSMQLYNTALAGFAAWYKACHKPLPRGQFRL